PPAPRPTRRSAAGTRAATATRAASRGCWPSPGSRSGRRMAEPVAGPLIGPRAVLGVLGGVGPVASAELVRSVYRHCAGEREQDFPAVFLWSDPSFDTRSRATMDDPAATLPGRLAHSVTALLAQGCTH